MYCITIAHEKGGVAKTTTTISLGACLAEQEYKVLLIDLDAQANLSLSLGFEAAKIDTAISDIILDRRNIQDAIKNTAVPNLHLIPSNRKFGLAERYLPSISNYEGILKAILTNANLCYDFILLDCPPLLGAVTLNAMTSANLLIIPTQAEYFSIYSLRNLMGLVRQVRNQYNPNLTYRILLTLVDSRIRAHRILSEQLRTAFSTGIFNTVIEIDTKVRESAISGVPITTYSPNSRAANQYRAFTQEILSYVKETTVQQG